jgi:hypothetical protein
MKTKVFLLAWILVFSITYGKAQDQERRVKLAISVEPHFNWMHADENSLSAGAGRLGINGGLRVDYRFEKFYALSFGVNWNQTGGNIIYNEPLYLGLSSGTDTLRAGTKVTYRLQYVEVPLAIKFLTREIGYSTWFFEIGLDPMFNIQAYIDANDNSVVKEPFKPGVNRFNLAWHTGIGLNYSLGGSVSLQFAITYKNTFLDVTRENDIRTPDNVRINVVGFNVGLLF